MNTTTAAVVVTYNRKKLLRDCVGALLAQTKPLERIFIVDNASNDGTADDLRAASYLNHDRVTYIRLDENVGGAGGFHAGMKAAYEAGYDWLWIMDDDAEPYADAYERLSRQYADDVRAVASSVIDPDGSFAILHRGWFRKGFFADRFEALDASGYAQEAVPVSFCSFVGFCVSRKTIDAVGLPRADFFIYCDDAEYCLRMRPLGPIVLATSSRVAHKAASWAANTRTYTIFSKRIVRIKYDKLWIRYYLVRNATWLGVRSHKWFCSLRAIVNALMLVPGILVFDDHKWTRIRFWFAASIDGIVGRFDNEKPKRILASPARCNDRKTSALQ
jgi:rhamnopyranosyl-N-acetylglucosaminyl-diphospho-decaprenol beta-1,3/1,4-galactofuranosyltransferase